MSDPSRPADKALTIAQQALGVAPDSIYHRSKESQDKFEWLGKTDNLTQYFADFDWQPKHAVELVPSLHSKEHVQKSNGPKYASVSMEPGTCRLRSAVGKQFINAGYAYLPEEHQYASREAVKQAIEKSIRVEGPGARMYLGRLSKHYRKKSKVYKFTRDPKDDRIDVILIPSDEEARKSVKVVGCWLPDLAPEVVAALEPLPIAVKHGEDGGVRITKKSANGLPTEGDSDNTQALKVAIGLAQRLAEHLVKAYAKGGESEVAVLVKHMRTKLPHLTTCLGKCKADVYTMEKYENFELRFYNVVPRPILILCQSVTQMAANFKKNILQDDKEDPQHSYFGMSLAYGNAEKLFSVLQKQTEEGRPAYSVAGDDTIYVKTFAYRGKKFTVMAAGDATSFDLTQLNEVTEPVHRFHRESLSTVNAPRAALWYEFMRERDVVIANTLVEGMGDCGVSGMAYQSEVNCSIASIFLERVDAALNDWFAELLEVEAMHEPKSVHALEDFMDIISWTMQNEGRRLGLKMKIEDICGKETDNIKEILSERPFYYVGYFFHVINGMIVPFCDFKKTMAKGAYPSGPQLKDKRVVHKLEALRIASVVMSMGIPPLELYAPYTAMRSDAIVALRSLIDAKDGGGDYEPQPGMEDYLDHTVLGPLLPNNAKGLLRLLVKPPEVLWCQPVFESFSDPAPSKEAPVTATGRWADQEEEGRALLKDAFGIDIGEEQQLPQPGFGPEASAAREERPPTADTQGRPPPKTTREARERHLQAAKERRERIERLKASRAERGFKAEHRHESSLSAIEAHYAEMEEQLLMEQQREEEEAEHDEEGYDLEDLSGKGFDITQEEAEDYLAGGGQLAKGSM